MVNRTPPVTGGLATHTQSLLVLSKSKMKSSYSGCVNENANVTTISSTIYSSTTGGTVFVSGSRSCRRCFGIDKGNTAERMFESEPPGRDDALAYMDPLPLLELSKSKLEVYNSTSMETAPTIDMTEGHQLQSWHFLPLRM
jgi:hypothetical protein